jgi:Reverse transcriptase (RNA-dependent DNA polymerase)/Retroviral aspartyl protease/Zinc knuckle
LFEDYWTELKDYESMLGDVSEREKYTTMREGLNDDLKKQMLVFTGVPMKEFAAHAARIDPQLMKARRERKAKDSKKSTASDSASTVSKVNKSGTSQSATQLSIGNRRFRSSKRSSPARKPVVKELRPEITRQEADRRGLCRHCKESGHLRRDCPKLQQAQQPSANAIYSLIPPEAMRSAFRQAPLPVINKIRQGYAVKDTRSYRDVTLGKPKLEVPSWSIDKKTPIVTSPVLPRLEEPLIARVRINNVESRCLIDTGASGDFVSSHFTFINRLKHRKLGSAIPIQQAVKGSKPKCNAIATATLQFGDWSKKTSMDVIHLANYDAIIGLPTLIDAGAQFDLASNTLHLQEYGVSLPLELPAQLPPLRVVNHQIPVKIEKPWMAPLYRLPEHHKKALEADIELKLRAGIIVPTTEIPLATSHMVPKKDPGEFRHVQDLRRRNKDTETLVWPLPLTDDIVDKVARSPERSKIDLVQSFDQIRVDPADVVKTAFRTHRGNYLHLTMQMGDKNATSTEQQLLDTIFDPIRDNVVNYLDDILPVNTRTPYEHFLVLCKIFDILRAQKLYVNRRKTKLYIS